MKIKGKKKGSTFLIVMVLMSIIFTVGSAILAVTASDYKTRINESKKLQNLYLADSGLDIVENIIIKSTQEAIKYADNEVKKEILNLSNENLNDNNYINNVFKRKFYEFLTVNNKKYININGNQEKIDLLPYLILENKYIENIKDNGEIEYQTIEKENDFEISISENGYLVTEDGIEISVTSTFENKDEQLKNRKTISTKYIVSAPEYTTEISQVNILSIYDKKAITIDGNMSVDGEEGKENNLEITGDIWVKGNGEDFTDSEFTFEKYKGGIDLKNSNFKINGNVYTNESLSLRNNVKDSIINGSLYARNMYIGKEVGALASSNNRITIKKDVIVNNDLALNASNSSILIENNFYGINDKTAEVETSDKALSSSSIIVNESTNSNITINKDSYIMGVAYINATDSEGNKYQTGESIAVKGNYLAYSDVKGINESIKLKYYSPLQLLESINGDSSIETKADYFSKYYSNSDSNYKYNEGGVKILGNVKSVGASIKDSNGTIQKTNITDTDSKIIGNIRKEFASNVFAMGDTSTLDNLYENQEVVKTVKNQVDFEKVKKIQNNDFNEEEGIVLLKVKENESDDIVIENNKYNGKEIKKGLILTNANITIKGDFEFTGNIISTGNITFEVAGNKIIKYDSNVIKNILSLNNELQSIFNVDNSSTSEIRINASSDIYNKDNFLKTSAWKIEK